MQFKALRIINMNIIFHNDIFKASLVMLWKALQVNDGSAENRKMSVKLQVNSS